MPSRIRPYEVIEQKTCLAVKKNPAIILFFESLVQVLRMPPHRHLDRIHKN